LTPLLSTVRAVEPRWSVSR